MLRKPEFDELNQHNTDEQQADMEEKGREISSDISESINIRLSKINDSLIFRDIMVPKCNPAYRT